MSYLQNISMAAISETTAKHIIEASIWFEIAHPKLWTAGEYLEFLSRLKFDAAKEIISAQQGGMVLKYFPVFWDTPQKEISDITLNHPHVILPSNQAEKVIWYLTEDSHTSIRMETFKTI